MTPYRELCIKELTAQTSDATAGTRSNHAHGLGYAPTARHCFPQARGVDGDVDDAPAIVVVKANKNSVTFDLLLFIQNATPPNFEA